MVIPAFDAAATVGQAVDSAMASSADEVIVVDDGSRDDTVVVAKQHGAHVISQVNAGASKARTAGIAAARGDLITLLDADDELVPNGVRESIRTIESAPDVIAVGGRTLGVWPSGDETEWPIKYQEITLRAMLESGFGPWPPGAAVVRRAGLLSNDPRLPLPLHTRHAEDYELFIRLAVLGRVERQESVSLRYRLYAGKATTSSPRVLRCKQRIRKYYGSWLDLADFALSDREIRCQELLYKARHAQVARRPLVASGWLARAALAHPGELIKSGRQFLNGRGLTGVGVPG